MTPPSTWGNRNPQPKKEPLFKISFGGGSMTDTEAMEKIQDLLDGVEWSPDTLDEIRVLVERTGRLVSDTDS